MSNHAASGPFKNVHHICIVVPDIAEATDYFESIGIGPWTDYPSFDEYTDLSMERSDLESLTFVYCDSTSPQFQLCQPSDADTSQRKFLDEHGAGVYHIGFDADDVDAAEQAGKNLSLSVISRGRRDDGSGFTYFGTRPQIGVTLEVRKGSTAH